GVSLRRRRRRDRILPRRGYFERSLRLVCERRARLVLRVVEEALGLEVIPHATPTGIGRGCACLDLVAVRLRQSRGERCLGISHRKRREKTNQSYAFHPRLSSWERGRFSAFFC